VSTRGGIGGSGLLRSRLLVPRVPPDCLPRPQLVDRLLGGFSGRLVTVLAGAGYGKTTLLAQALARVEVPSIWCSCDARMTDSATLLAHLAEGISGSFPGFGAHLDLRDNLDAQVAALSNEVAETISEDFVLALDDIHTLPTAPGEALGALVRDLPPFVHLAMAGRAPLPFAPRGARVGRVLEVGEREMALGREEAHELLSGAGPALEARLIDELYDTTEGWVTGLILGAQVGVTRSRGGSLQAEGLFDYLAEEVLAGQPRELSEFLEATAVLDRFTPEVAGALSGRSDTRELCRELIHRHLFTVRLEAEGHWYRYHHLFQAFLRARLAARGGEAVRAQHLRAADAWVKAGEPAEAVRHLLEAGEPTRAIDVIDPIAERMLNSPEAGTLADWLREIPADLWRDRPALVLAEATLLFHEGRFTDAFDALERALERLIATGEHERAATAYFQLIYMQMVVGTPQRRGVEVGRRYLPRLDAETPMLALSTIMMASEAGCACDYEEAAEGLRRAAALPAPNSSPLLPAITTTMRALFVDHPSGRSDEALGAMDQAIETLEAHAEEDRLGFMVLALILRALVLNHLGQFVRALEDAERASSIAEKRGTGAGLERVLTKLRAVALAGIGRFDDLEVELGRAGPRERLLGSNYAFRLAAPAARLAAHRGDVTGVAREIALARAAIAAYGFSFDVPMWLCDLAESAWEVGLAETAAELQAEAVAAAERARTPWSRTRAALVGALVYEDDAEAADRWLAEALDRSALHGYAGIWAGRDHQFAGPLLARALERGLGPPGEAQAVLAQCGEEVFASCASALAGAPAPVRAELARLAGSARVVSVGVIDGLLRDRSPEVRDAARAAWARVRRRPRAAIGIVTLGRFGVARDGHRIPDAAFGRQKARTLLAALVAAAPAPAHREALYDWLWPELGPDRAGAALRTTLHELRRALQPELDAGSADSLLQSDGEALALELGPRDDLDCLRFLALARLATTTALPAGRLVRLEAAERAYGGPFLAEWPYADWAAHRRTEVEEAGRAVLVELAEALAAAGRTREAVAYWRRLVVLEPERESWHRALMRLYARSGDRALALRQYHACRALLRRDLGIEPGPGTRALYEEILRDEQSIGEGAEVGTRGILSADEDHSRDPANHFDSTGRNAVAPNAPHSRS